MPTSASATVSSKVNESMTLFRIPSGQLFRSNARNRPSAPELGWIYPDLTQARLLPPAGRVFSLAFHYLNPFGKMLSFLPSGLLSISCFPPPSNDTSHRVLKHQNRRDRDPRPDRMPLRRDVATTAPPSPSLVEILLFINHFIPFPARAGPKIKADFCVLFCSNRLQPLSGPRWRKLSFFGSFFFSFSFSPWMPGFFGLYLYFVV